MDVEEIRNVEIEEEDSIDILDLLNETDEEAQIEVIDQEEWLPESLISTLSKDAFVSRYIKSEEIKTKLMSDPDADLRGSYLLDKLVGYFNKNEKTEKAADLLNRFQFGESPAVLYDEVTKTIDSEINGDSRKNLIENLSSHIEKQQVNFQASKFEEKKSTHARGYDSKLRTKKLRSVKGLVAAIVSIIALGGIGAGVVSHYLGYVNKGNMQSYQQKHIKKYEDKYNIKFEQIRDVVNKK